MMTDEIREKIRMLAREALAYFESRERHDGTKYLVIADGAPEWVKDLAWAAHNRGEILPDDFRYRFIVEALEALAEAESPEGAYDFLEPDIYVNELVEWLGAHPAYRAGLVDEAAYEFGWNGLSEALRAGQLREKEEVLGLVREFLEEMAEDEEED